MKKTITKEQYNGAFGGKRSESALKYAMEIRKFEIDLYWKRAGYFWTFIGASFAGYAAVQGVKEIPNRESLTVILSCLGLVFSFAWYCVNKGSKLWQENWENHVDLLEDETIGPLYKIVLMRGKAKTRNERITNALTGPAEFSVSRINQMISLYVTVVWVLLLISALFPSLAANHRSCCYWAYVIAVLLTLWGFFKFGKTSLDVHRPIAYMRETEIQDHADQRTAPPPCVDAESQVTPLPVSISPE